MTTSNLAPPHRHLNPRPPRDVLRQALVVDATMTSLNGLAYLVGAEAIDGLLGVDVGWLRGAGGFLLAFGLAVGALARRPRLPDAAVWTVVVINAVWGLDGLLVAAIGWGSPSAVGTAWIIAQALVVGSFAGWQATAVRSRAVPAAHHGGRP